MSLASKVIRAIEFFLITGNFKGVNVKEMVPDVWDAFGVAIGAVWIGVRLFGGEVLGSLLLNRSCLYGMLQVSVLLILRGVASLISVILGFASVSVVHNVVASATNISNEGRFGLKNVSKIYISIGRVGNSLVRSSISKVAVGVAITMGALTMVDKLVDLSVVDPLNMNQRMQQKFEMRIG